MIRKVRPGGPLRIPAEAFNAFVDAVSDLRARQQSPLGDPVWSSWSNNIVRVRNDSGQDRSRFEILGLADVLFDPAEDQQAFLNHLVFSGVTPTADDAARFVILAQPLATSRIGFAIAAGICPVRVDIKAATDTFAEAVPGECAFLRSASGSGGAQILWKPEAVTGQQWTVVRLGKSGGGGSERKYGRITTVEGSAPPFLYSAEEVVPAANGTWTTKAGGELISSNLYNIGETAYPGVGKLPVGRVVVYWAGAGCWLCDVLNYRGTYG